MFGKNKSKRQVDPNSPKSRSSVPVTRYYKSSQQPTNARKTKNDSKNRSISLGNNSKAGSFFKSLPQKILTLAVVLLLLVNLTMSSSKVKVIESEQSSSYRSSEKYHEGVESLMNSNVLYKTKLTFSSSRFEAELEELYPELDYSTAVVPLAGRKLQVGLKFEKPLVRLQIKKDQQGIVGDNGKLFLITDTNTALSNFSDIPSMTIEPKVDFIEGSQVLTSAESELIELLNNEFDGSEEYRPKLDYVEFNVKNRELKAFFKGQTMYGKLTPERNSQVQVGALVATMSDFALNRGGLPVTYIDVRVDKRVFVK